jgi:RNA polymerase sigma-70 factor (ECF subfamily)
MSKVNSDFVGLLFQQYGRDLLGFLRARLRGSDAEDIAQKAYLQLLQHPDPGTIQNARAYLFRTANNLMLNHVRHQRVRGDHVEFDADPDAVSSPLPLPDAELESARELQQLREVLAELPPLCRHAFLLHRLDGLTHAQIARRLGVSPRTVERYIIRAFDLCYSRLGRRREKSGP